MKTYKITYHMYPVEDIVISIMADSFEDAVIYAKQYREDAFRIEEVYNRIKERRKEMKINDKVEQVKELSIVGRMNDTFTVNYDRIPDNLKDQLSPADLAHLVDAFYRCYGENRRLSGKISPICRRITVPQWRNIPAGAEVESGFHYTLTAPEGSGTYTLYELTDKKNCHRGWEWEKDMDHYTEYAIINCEIEEAPFCSECVIFESQNAEEIVEKLKELTVGENSPEDFTVEIYTVDEDGDFVEGSDFDTVENFIKRMKTN